MITWAKMKDQREVQKIWKTCFGDPNDYIHFFIKYHLPLERCLAYKKDGKIVSMLFLLPSRCFYQGKEYPVQYVYAAATLPAFRKQGLMERLLAYTREIAQHSQMLFTCLKPANEDLYRYYGKFGYCTAFHTTHLSITYQEEVANLSFKSASADELFALREQSFPVGLRWDREMFAFVLRDWQMANGEYLLFQDGYCLARTDGSKVLCKEVVPGRYTIEQIGNALCARYGLQETAFSLPWNGDKTEDGGMIQPVSSAIDCQKFEQACPYFNLMLD